MPREFDAYSEQFPGSQPNRDGKYPWLLRIYSYKNGLQETAEGLSDSEAGAKADALAEAKSLLRKYRKVPE